VRPTGPGTADRAGHGRQGRARPTGPTGPCSLGPTFAAPAWGFQPPGLPPARGRSLGGATLRSYNLLGTFGAASGGCPLPAHPELYCGHPPAAGGPWRHHSTSLSASGSPSATISMRSSGRLRAQPEIPRARACSAQPPRYQLPGLCP
jgi:hypothetical protein